MSQDFEIARNETRLLPSDITWTEFCAFSKDFLDISDDDVSERYHYGELRLTRLYLYAKLIIGKFQYERVHGQYGAFFACFYGPLLFIFGILSIILSGMQVELGYRSFDECLMATFLVYLLVVFYCCASVHGAPLVGPNLAACWYDR